MKYVHTFYFVLKMINNLKMKKYYMKKIELWDHKNIDKSTNIKELSPVGCFPHAVEFYAENGFY